MAQSVKVFDTKQSLIPGTYMVDSHRLSSYFHMLTHRDMCSPLINEYENECMNSQHLEADFLDCTTVLFGSSF